MATVDAQDTTVGTLYRRTRGEHPGAWLERVSDPTTRLVKRERTKQGLPSCDAFTLRKLRAGWVPFRWHLRGIDPGTGNRFEIKRLMAVPPDYRLRSIQEAPGYTRVKD